MSQSYTNIGRKAALRKGLPVSLRGIDFYPITMLHYEEFLLHAHSLSVRLSSLPAKYISKPYIKAIFEYDMENKKTQGVCFFNRFLKILQLSLRVDWSVEDLSKIIVGKEKDGIIELEGLLLMQQNNIVFFTVEEVSFEIRSLIAELNGIDLPDESENLDLVVSNEQKKQYENSKSPKLKISIDDLIASVAYHSHCRESELTDWTVREFEMRRKAIERGFRYFLCGQSEMSGMASFKKGNPAPSWCYDILDESLGTQSLSDLSFGDAKQKL